MPAQRPFPDGVELDTGINDAAPPTETELEQLDTPEELGIFASDAVGAPRTPDVPAATSESIDDRLTERRRRFSRRSGRCVSVPTTSSARRVTGSTDVVVGVDESRDLAIAYEAANCRRSRPRRAFRERRLTSPTCPSNPLTDPNWATETTDIVVSLIDTVRSKTTQNLVYAARGVVFGLIALIVGAFALTIALVMLMRGLQSLLELATTWERAVYLSYFIVGGVVLHRRRVAVQEAQHRRELIARPVRPSRASRHPPTHSRSPHGRRP